MATPSTDPPPDPDGIAALIETNPAQAAELLKARGYSVEEWKRASAAPAAVEHPIGSPAAAPAVEPAP